MNPAFIAAQFNTLLSSARHIEDEYAYEAAAKHFSKELYAAGLINSRLSFLTACGVECPEKFGPFPGDTA
jgi:hypothetical protein